MVQSMKERCGYSTVENGDNNDWFYFSKHDGSFERASIQPTCGSQRQVDTAPPVHVTHDDLMSPTGRLGY